MPQRRQLRIALLTAFVTAALVAAPLHVTVKGWTLSLGAQVASAKDGKGGGPGKGGGGPGAGPGKGGGGPGAGPGKGGGPGAGPGKSGAGKSGQKSKKAAVDGTPSEQYNPRTGDSVLTDGANIEVRHRNGMREKISDGSYEMRDNKGRTIIVRPATGADLSRLRDLRS